MLFNSLSFAIFFPIVVIIFFALPQKWKAPLLLVVSYYFYMCWKVEYVVLIIISTLVDYYVSLQMAKLKRKKNRRKWLYISLFVNLGILFGFKYFNFISDSARDLFQIFNIFVDTPTFNLLLPVGISFYTFQTLSYTIDVYNGKIKPEKKLGIFALYVSFFPQLVAGPIERPDRLIPQFYRKKRFVYKRVVDGLKLMLWGFFLKLVIADRLAPIVNEIFNHPDEAKGLQVAIGAFFFAFQIFGDFAGYSSIAIGAAKVMGYRLMDNFNRPYFATSVQDFWRRWHISLSTWFRDYVYIPLGGNRVVKWRWYYNVFITFLISGLWHGANWTFVVWGALHGLYLVIALMTISHRKQLMTAIGIDKSPNLLRLWQISSTFLLVCVAWIFFRANNVQDAFLLINNMVFLEAPLSLFSIDFVADIHPIRIYSSLFFIAMLLILHFIDEFTPYRNPLWSSSVWSRWSAYVFFTIIILGFGVFTHNEFIYFQF